MLRKGNLLLLFLIAFPLFSLAQEKKPQDAYVEYFELPRESLFLHTNKTTYLAGEEIWFTAYAFDRKSNLSSKATTNLYVGLYDKSGKQIDKKLFLAKEGIASGNIAIDSTFASGEYFLKTSTNWMKNFKEDDSFVQKIIFINPNSKTAQKQKISKKEYDIQFLPEGGHILSEVKNIIGVKAIDDKGKGTSATGIIVNSKGVEITNFKTNFLGLGKFSFIPEKGEKYTTKITLDNSKEIEQDIPKVNDIGFTINVNNIRPKDVIITLATNSKSLALFESELFKLFVHKDGEAKIIPVVFDAKLKRVVIDKSGLFKGVNTITLFNSKNQPLLERMFFNDAFMSNTKLDVKNIEVLGDSINYDLASSDGKLINASISVLPNKTISYDPKHTIVSSFYLNPYLKGTVENPQYYFRNFDQKRKYELDILLLTQGWSRYDWDDVLNFPPDPKFDFENGIAINGFLNTNLNKVESLLMYPSELNNSAFIKYDEKGKFHIKNFYPIAGEELRFSYINKKGDTRKPGMALSFLGRMSEDVLEVPKDNENLVSFYTDKNSIPKGFLSPQNELLDEIVLKAKLEKQKRRQYRLPFRGKLFNVDRKLAQNYIDLSHFLNFNGFVVDNIGLNPTRLGQVAIRHNFPRRGPVVVYLDNNQLNNFNPVANRTLDEFEDIYIDDTPNVNLVSVGGASATFVVVIKLFSSKTSVWTLEDRAMQNISKVPFGFEKSKIFYTPKYIEYNIKPFHNYGVIHWQPRVITGDNSDFRMTTVDTGLDEINFYIEGITSDGNVFSQVVKVDATKKN